MPVDQAIIVVQDAAVDPALPTPDADAVTKSSTFPKGVEAAQHLQEASDNPTLGEMLTYYSCILFSMDKKTKIIITISYFITFYNRQSTLIQVVFLDPATL